MRRDHTMSDVKTPLLDVHQTTTATPTSSISTFRNVIYHLSFLAVLLWQFHVVLTEQCEEIPGPGVSAVSLDSYILLFAAAGFLYRQAYHMAKFNEDSILLHVPETFINVSLALILLNRADLAFSAVLFSTCLLCVITSIMAITSLWLLCKAKRNAMEEEDQQKTSNFQACQIV